MTEVLGVNPLAEHWTRSADRTTSHVAEEALEALVAQALEARQSARQERDFARADAIRDELAAVGISIEDTPSGARWSLNRSVAVEDPVGVAGTAGAGED
jgi:cysteinyl-tRNA synthetase